MLALVLVGHCSIYLAGWVDVSAAANPRIPAPVRPAAQPHRQLPASSGLWLDRMRSEAGVPGTAEPACDLRPPGLQPETQPGLPLPGGLGVSCHLDAQRVTLVPQACKRSLKN